MILITISLGPSLSYASKIVVGKYAVDGVQLGVVLVTAKKKKKKKRTEAQLLRVAEELLQDPTGSCRLPALFFWTSSRRYASGMPAPSYSAITAKSPILALFAPYVSSMMSSFVVPHNWLIIFEAYMATPVTFPARINLPSQSESSPNIIMCVASIRSGGGSLVQDCTGIKLG